MIATLFCLVAATNIMAAPISVLEFAATKVKITKVVISEKAVYIGFDGQWREAPSPVDTTSTRNSFQIIRNDRTQTEIDWTSFTKQFASLEGEVVSFSIGTTAGWAIRDGSICVQGLYSSIKLSK